MSKEADKREAPPPTLDSEIRIADQALASAVGRAIGLSVEHKSFALLLAEIHERDEDVHDRLLGYLAAHHIYLRRSADWETSPSEDASAKLNAAAQIRDRQITALRRALRRHRPQSEAVPDLPLDPPACGTEPALPKPAEGMVWIVTGNGDRED